MSGDYVVTRRVKNRYLVRERDRRRLRDLGRVTAAVICVGAGLIAYTWLHLASRGTGYRIEALRRDLGELERVERHLRLEQAYLSSPPRVASRAAEELGMRPPELDEMVFVDDAGGPLFEPAEEASSDPARGAGEAR